MRKAVREHGTVPSHRGRPANEGARDEGHAEGEGERGCSHVLARLGVLSAGPNAELVVAAVHSAVRKVLVPDLRIGQVEACQSGLLPTQAEALSCRTNRMAMGMLWGGSSATHKLGSLHDT